MNTHFLVDKTFRTIPMEQNIEGFVFFFNDGGGGFKGGFVEAHAELNSIWEFYFSGKDNSGSLPNIKMSRMNK